MNSKDVRNRLEEIAAFADSRPLEARLALLELIGGLVDGKTGLYYSIVMRNGKPYSVDMQGMGPQEYLDDVATNEGTSMEELFRKKDGTLGEVLLDNPYFKPGYSIGEAAWIAEFASYELFFKPHRIRSILGSYFFIDDKIAGWAGVYRNLDQASFSRHDLALVQEHEPRLLELFATTSPCNRWELGEKGVIGLLDDDGAVVQACADAPAWFAQGRICGELRTAAREFVKSAELSREIFIRRLAVTLTRLHGGHGPSVIVQLVPTAGQPVPAMVNLTKRQRAVAQEMLAGATIQEAASNLHLSPETVRSHLKAIYLALGVSTRVELARVLRSEGRTSHGDKK